MATATIKANHKPIQGYYRRLQDFRAQGVSHETAIRMAFQNLLADTSRPHGWTLVPELTMKVRGRIIRPDGTLRDDEWRLHRGYWEAKDTDDNLNAEISKKADQGYPLFNTIFEDSRVGVLYQDDRETYRAALKDPSDLAMLLNRFYEYTKPDYASFERAADEFKDQVPLLARGLLAKIHEAYAEIPDFKSAFDSLLRLCRDSLNPNICRAAADEMLVQHLLTERVFDKIFKDQDFVRRNVIAIEIEKVIAALVSRSFNRHEFLKSLDPLYRAMEKAASAVADFGQKQQFLNTVYERFFRGYSVKVADTHGIVYTPQEVVDFMCSGVVEVLREDFGKELGDPGVQILDPCTGTGNFIVNLIRRVNRRNLTSAYRSQFYANEVLLLPYYIASMNIEHEYFEITKNYESFSGMCFADALELDGKQRMLPIMAEENTARVGRQQAAPITIVIGNPPYNVGQLNENDNNKNRRYPAIEERIRRTFAKDSSASNKNALSDAYVKFYRWSIDRLTDRAGIVCFVSNNGFLDGVAFDGFRRHLLRDFDTVYHFNLKGNARTTGERRRREGGNIFNDMVRVGVGITLLVRSPSKKEKKIHYFEVDDYWGAEQKLGLVAKFDHLSEVPWRVLNPDDKGTWLVPENAGDYADFIPIGSKAAKATKGQVTGVIFATYGRGVATCRDDTVYDEDPDRLRERICRFVEDYNGEVDRYKRQGVKPRVDDFVSYDKLKWSRDLKLDLARGRYAKFDEGNIRPAMYRPYCSKYLYFDRLLNEEVYVFPRIFPKAGDEHGNQVIALTDVGSEWPLAALAAKSIVDLHFAGVGANSTQCFPLYTYDEDGSNRRENITDWALEQFQSHYKNDGILKLDIYWYIYAVLNHPGYREGYAANFRRELPRIPFLADFAVFADAGKELGRLHRDYETVEPWPLDWVQRTDRPISFRVEKMVLGKDRSSVLVNDTLALAGIPPEALRYRLGNRSALEWVIDQYQVSEDKRTGAPLDPNRRTDPEYIVKTIERVVRVSVETMRILDSLPDLSS